MNTHAGHEKRLETVYKYFSHHMRTNTAVIVAMLEAIEDGLSDESITQMVMESGYLLDVFDRGMSVSFNYLFGKDESSEPEEIEIALLVEVFATNAVTKDGSCEVDIDIPENIKVNCEPYSFKSIVQIFLHEAALAAKSGFSVVFSKNTLEITPDKSFYENPPVFAIFSDLLAKHGITLDYDKISIKLRFPDESINS
ncbi:MAG: hypothetical protein C0602_03515 [Denitrovibrio sp.]|nr:MAG: hypothetical protein C0602_03515 [Denitrovibrio sp.]